MCSKIKPDRYLTQLDKDMELRKWESLWTVLSNPKEMEWNKFYNSGHSTILGFLS